MNIPIFVLLACCLLPIICSWVSGYYRYTQLGVVDNEYPRTQNMQLKDAGARAVAAQQNAWEALIVYAAALFAVYSVAVPVEQYAHLTAIFLLLRVCHAICYISNWDKLRSIAFVGGYGICIYLFILAL